METNEQSPYPFLEGAKVLLFQVWDEVMAIDDLDAARDPGISPVLERLVQSGGSTYPFMLVTQLLGKATNQQLNALCIQDSSDLGGAWDARSLAAKVVTEWNAQVGKPFPGNNRDPYVNNPARYKNFGPEMEAKARSQHQYAELSSVVSRAQAGDAKEARNLLRLALVEARRVLEKEKREYFGPPRISADEVMGVVGRFLEERSNGVRLQIVTYAMYRALAEAFQEIGEVSSASTNTADNSSKRTGDVECTLNGKVWLAVEVKDRKLTASDVEATALKARRNDVTNVLFVVHAQVLFDDPDAVHARIQHHFARGVDLNVVPAMPFFFNVLVLLNAEHRAHLLRKIHDALHEQGAHYKHVSAWMELLQCL